MEICYLFNLVTLKPKHPGAMIVIGQCFVIYTCTIYVTVVCKSSKSKRFTHLYSTDLHIIYLSLCNQ